MTTFTANNTKGTHLPMLLEAFYRTEGPVLELGAGLFSTGVLALLCRMAERPLTTVERNREWLGSVDHPGRIVETVDCFAASETFGLALIDGEVDDRLPAILRLRGRVAVFVLHDWNYRTHYKYPTDWKYLRSYDMLSPSTAICSDTQDVRVPLKRILS